MQLQDRIDESIKVFSHINLEELQSWGNVSKCQVTYDYMKAYFDFFTDDEQAKFVNAREIVEKYINYPIEHFRVMFKKIKEQIDEIDQAMRRTSEKKKG